MKLRNSLLALSLITFVAPAPAQPGPVCPPASSDQLTMRWYESEGEWWGNWEPTAPPTTGADGSRIATYHAVLHKNNERVESTLTITVTGTHVEIARTDTPNMRNTCHYRGSILASGRAQGTYTCSFHPKLLTWRAKIGDAPSPYCADNDPRLGVTWHEREGDWTGEWSPTGVPGQFSGHFRKGREINDAPLTISIGENGINHARNWVTVRRNDGRGSCTYEGFLDAGGWHVNGRYECSWGGGNLPWSATLGAGHP